jgi:hypothetical protein
MLLRNRKSWIAITIVAVLAFGAGYFYYAFTQALEACMRMGCGANVKQLALAIQNYESQYHQYPPAYTVDAEGNRLHSWRAIILPFLEQKSLYAKIDFTQPWDHPNNAEARETEVLGYRCPSSFRYVPKCFTTYFALDDPTGVVWGETGRTKSELDDFTNRIMLYETSPGNAVHWMEPKDGDLQMLIDTIAKSKTYRDRFAHGHGTNAALGDGERTYIPITITREGLRSLRSRD